MRGRSGRRQRPALTKTTLEELALHYVGRFATSRSKLASYLDRKLRERGWDGTSPPDPQGVAERLAGLGYVDDAAFASAKARSLTARGYGGRRVGQALHAAGIAEDDRAGASEHVEAEAVTSALRFAERRRIGPFASSPPDPPAREKAIAAMLRAGHSFGLARAIVALRPGEKPDPDLLAGGR